MGFFSDIMKKVLINVITFAVIAWLVYYFIFHKLLGL